MYGTMSQEVLYGLLVACVIACFFVGHAMDGVMGQAGFGVLGNMLILLTGLFIGIFAADMLGLQMNRTEILVGTAVAGPFAALMLLVLVKLMFLRID